MARYRLYIDESGTHNYPLGSNPKTAQRYLSLTDVIIENQHYVDFIQRKTRDIKLLIATDPDHLPILHREDILSGKGDFAKLKDPDIRQEFDRMLMEILGNEGFIICTVVLDKSNHLKKYGPAAYHPYNYCLNLILEKYTHCLHINKSKGDVMAEARGGKDDRVLEKEYKKFYKLGTQFRSSEYVQSVLTSADLKIRRKELGIEGLEIADLLTLASKIDVLHSYGVITSLEPNFQTKIIRTIQPRYHRNGNQIKGYGKKFLG